MSLWLIVVVGLSAVGSGRAAPADPMEVSVTLSLAEALCLARAHNPEWRAAAARVEAARGRARQAGVWSNPELEFAIEDWPVTRGGGLSDAKQTVGIAQTLPYPGKKSLEAQAGAAGTRGSVATLALRRASLEREVKVAFYRVLAGTRLVEVSRQLVAAAESTAATARKRVEAGAAAYQEQLRAEVQGDQARTEALNHERDLTGARTELATLLGRSDLDGVTLRGGLAEVPDAVLLTADAAAVLARHPGIQVADANLERTRLEQRRARLEPYPDVRVGLAGGRLGETDESIIQLGVSLPLPIFDRSRGRQQEALANVVEAEAGREAVGHQLRREWIEAQTRYRTAARQVGDYRERILPKSEEALRLVQLGFEQGKFGFIDWIDTQRTAAEVRLAYQQRLLELNLAQADLEALLPAPSDSTPSTR